jgi:hypothetical protein
MVFETASLLYLIAGVRLIFCLRKNCSVTAMEVKQRDVLTMILASRWRNSYLPVRSESLAWNDILL